MGIPDRDRRQIDTFGVFLDIMSRSSRASEPPRPTRSGHRVGVVTEVRSETIRRVEVELGSRERSDGGVEATRALISVYDPDRMSRVGDRVEIAPNRCTSKSKRWRVVGIVTSRPGTLAALPAGRDEGR